ncbi:MAG: fasciclin domain-containing protein [Bacteroidales bacterium]|jgi:uncharacterized surface protein with fasciclin (FAS1) repeats|nr:fasciclin domain-containing protein [Bacteroidales bacterium]
MSQKIIYGIVFLLTGMIIFSGCEKKFDEYYEIPDDLIGTILDVLEEDGNYTRFIEAVELVEFDDVLGKTGNFTVFAPDDAAFNAFLTQEGYSSLEDIPEEELKGIVFYHIVFWAYSKFMLLYGLNIQDANIEYSTLDFKRPTRYTPTMTVEFDTMGREYTVYHETKYIPVYSNEYFTELNLDAAENYNYLYPETPYGGFHVERAEIVEHDVPAQNGWIHKINKVLVPPGNHDDILEENPEYSLFKDLIEKKTFYQYNNTYTTSQQNQGDINEDGIIDSLFLKMNSIFPSGSSPAIENVLSNGSREILTLFAPTNTALQDFFNNHTTGYASIDKIGDYWINWYLSHYIGTNYWPSKFSTVTEDWEWELTSSLVDCNISETDVDYVTMASNGPFCGINKYFLPKIFESVVHPVMGNKDYEWFSNMLVFYLADKLLNEENIEFTIFAPSNEAISAAGYIFRTGLGGYGLYQVNSPLAPVSRNVATSIVNTHIVFGSMEEADFEEGTFFETSQKTYIGVKSDGIYAGGDLTSASLGTREDVSGKGVLYRVDRMLVSPEHSIFEIISDPQTYPQYQKFYQLCYESGLIILDEESRPKSLDNLSTGTFYSCFIPTNGALEAAGLDGTIPTEKEALQQYLKYHFVEGVVFDDGEKSGEFNTTRIDEASGYLFNTIEIVNQKYDLNVVDNLGNSRNVTNANHMAEDGVIHVIDAPLRFQ